MSNKKKIKPFGHWPSKITPEMTGDLLEFSELSWDSDGCLLWRERSSNKASLMRWNPDNNKITNLSGEINIDGGLMYGGGSYTVQGDQIVLVDKESKQLFQKSSQDKSPQRISENIKSTASPKIDPTGQTLLFIHSNGIVDNVRMLNLEYPKNQKILISGADFYNYLRWQPDGSHLAWISWDHPKMPWDSSQLFLGKLGYASDEFPSLEIVLQISGGDNVSVLQPEFSPDGQYLAFMSDLDSWWQIYLYNLESGDYSQLTCAQADHGLPPWLQDQCTYGFSSDSQRIYFIRNQLGFASLWQLDISTGNETRIDLDDDYTWLESLTVSPLDNQIALVASGGRKPPEIIVITPSGECQVIQKSSMKEIHPDLFSLPEAISMRLEDGESVHGLFYKPHNPNFQGKGKPPLIINVHSGPTRQKYAEFQPRTQYFTSRGFAVLEINYHGSTGYGRHYWEALKSRWGTADTSDVQRASQKMIEYELVDPDNIFLFGSSSGGFTVLNLLVSFPGLYKAGIVLYGVSDPLSLFEKSPKFERFYDYWLLGVYNNEKIIRSMSPLYSAYKISDPIAIFQGGNDPVVPQEQAEQIVEVLEENNIPHEYHLYPEEGHGFKKAENVYDFYQKTEAFLNKYLDQEK